MPDHDCQPEEKPRYLLPEGCKDIIDALRLQQRGSPSEHSLEECAPALGADSEPRPPDITLTDPVRVADLASALRIKPHLVIGALMHFNVFATLQTQIQFSTARELCRLYGVAAHRVT